MDKFNILENEPYNVNHEKIKAYLKNKESDLKFMIKKLINGNKQKKRLVLETYSKDYHIDDRCELLEDKLGRKLFQAFIISREPWDINETYNYLKCYDMCVEALKIGLLGRMLTPLFIENFIEVTPTYDWEDKIVDCFKNAYLGNTRAIRDLRKECIRKIRQSYEMRKFIEGLNRKNNIWMMDEQRKSRNYSEKVIDKLLLLMKEVQMEAQ